MESPLVELPSKNSSEVDANAVPGPSLNAGPPSVVPENGRKRSACTVAPANGANLWLDFSLGARAKPLTRPFVRSGNARL
jgi:hypothetical protein